MNWLFFALLSVFPSCLTAVNAKMGVKETDSNVTTGVRITVS